MSTPELVRFGGVADGLPLDLVLQRNGPTKRLTNDVITWVGPGRAGRAKTTGPRPARDRPDYQAPFHH